MRKDSIYNQLLEDLKPFRFDTAVAEVFDDMISRSVPGYEPVQSLSLKVAEHFAQSQTAIYDLGCSSGTTLSLLSHSSKIPQSTKIIGVDNSPSMLEKARKKLSAQNQNRVVTLECEELGTLNFERSSTVLLNYTLQFLPVKERLPLVKKIFNALAPGGALLLSEKVRCQSKELQEFVTSSHHAFKRNNGYSQLEISQKRQALEDVLVPLSLSENRNLLLEAGFDSAEPLLVSLPFATYIAIKET